jgi:hypothetical protein
MTSRGCSATSNPSPHHRPLTQRGRRSEATPGRSADPGGTRRRSRAWTRPTKSSPRLQHPDAPGSLPCIPAGMDAPMGAPGAGSGASWAPVRWKGTTGNLRGLWGARFFPVVGSTSGDDGQLGRSQGGPFWGPAIGWVSQPARNAAAPHGPLSDRRHGSRCRTTRAPPGPDPLRRRG